jgi:hypothetical protein
MENGKERDEGREKMGGRGGRKEEGRVFEGGGEKWR